MKGRKILLAFIISAVTLTSGCANGTPKTEEAKSEQKTTEENAVVPIKPITAKAIDDNPYMARVMPMFIRTVIIQIRQMKYYRLIFIRRLMFLMKK